MNYSALKNFRVERDDRRVLTVSLDVPGRPMNVLTADVMSELEQIVGDLESADDISAVVFQSSKESGFLAGADVNVIASIESASEASRLIEDGQLLFQRIEWLPMPTIAVIHGPCLGGGLEWALACNYRVARDNSSTKIGLPEIKLGLIPGWGGTQRLPKVIGTTEALSMILTGKHLSASEAHRIGLLDLAIEPDRWQPELDAFVHAVVDGRNLSHRPRSLLRRLLDGTSLGRALTLRITRRAIRSKTSSYPALAAAVDAIALAHDKSPAGFRCERDGFVEMLATATSKNLLDLFFARERARSLATWSHGAERTVHDDPLRRIGIVGAGAMGAGIGQLAAYRGFEVVLKEIDADAAEAGRARVERSISSLAKRKGWSPHDLADFWKRVTVSHEDTALSDCDLVIEAVVERADVKAQVFETLDRVVKRPAILASNTSSLSVTEMASATRRQQQVAGLHFFNPVHRMELVEVVRAPQTSDEAIARLVGLVRALGKTPVVTSDSPGFLVNRVLFPYLGEAVLMVSEGHDVSALDRQVRRFGMPMGPLELLDQVGLDVALHVARSLEGTLPGVAPVARELSQLVDAGRLGKKSNAGYYDYKGGKRGKPADLPQLSEGKIPKDSELAYEDDGLNLVQRRLVYPMLAEAVRCLEEQVVNEAWAIDLAMVLGTGFAPHRGGPLHVIDAVGPKVISHNLDRMAEVYGDRFGVPRMLARATKQSQLFLGATSAPPAESGEVAANPTTVEPETLEP